MPSSTAKEKPLLLFASMLLVSVKHHFLPLVSSSHALSSPCFRKRGFPSYTSLVNPCLACAASPSGALVTKSRFMESIEVNSNFPQPLFQTKPNLSKAGSSVPISCMQRSPKLDAIACIACSDIPTDFLTINSATASPLQESSPNTVKSLGLGI
jgi:hypothetical protein